MRLQKVAKAEQGISSLAARSASKFAKNSARLGAPGFRTPATAWLIPTAQSTGLHSSVLTCFLKQLVTKGCEFPPHDSLQTRPKYEGADFDTHRQIPGFV
jgi:hypothetical protein